MNRFLAMILALVMVFSMAGCHTHHWEAATCESPKICNDCDATEGEPLGHTPGEEVITAVDTTNLTVTYTVSCSTCGEEMQTRESATGIAPISGTIPLSPTEWFQCFTTNINLYGANQTLMPFTAESTDDALVHAVMSFKGFKAAFTFWDAEGNVITTDQQDQRGLAKTIHVEAQFSNEAAADFYQALMLIALTNNSTMDPTTAGSMANAIMGFDVVADNGYVYSMEILSKETKTVALTITVE